MDFLYGQIFCWAYISLSSVRYLQKILWWVSYFRYYENMIIIPLNIFLLKLNHYQKQFYVKWVLSRKSFGWILFRLCRELLTDESHIWLLNFVVKTKFCRRIFQNMSKFLIMIKICRYNRKSYRKQPIRWKFPAPLRHFRLAKILWFNFNYIFWICIFHVYWT